MKRILASATLILAASCGGPKAPDPTVATAAPTASDPAPTPPPAPSPAAPTATAEPAPTASAPAASTSASASSALDAGTSVKMDGGKVVVTNAIDISDKGGGAPSSSRTPGEVIGGLRPLFNQCFKDGMKKDPKLAGSVTMSAKIGQDGKVTAVTPKRLDGLNDATVKCLSDKLKAAQFASAGSPGYASAIDIPLSFSSSM